MKGKSAAILLSRQALRPSGTTAWIKQSVAAVRWVKNHQMTLCSSWGTQTWELLTALASMEKIPLIIFLPVTGDDFQQLKQFITIQFELDSKLIRFVPICRERKISKESRWHQRDQAVFKAADILVPVSLRPDGFMNHCLHQQKLPGQIIETGFLIDYGKRKRSLSYRLPVKDINPRLHRIKDKYLIHWTRTTNMAWPTEKLIDYYRAVIESNDYPRSAFNTLINILMTRKIVASVKNMPSKTPTVSFSALHPVEVLPLIKWRARFRHMSFEPYGVGIEKNHAYSMGVLPVHYYDREKDRPQAVNYFWLLQSIGRKTDWQAEKEFRCLGDFDFSAVAKRWLCVFCYTPEEADIIKRKTKIRPIPFLSRNST